MRIGPMRLRLSLQAPQRVSDGGGGATVTWVEEATVWGLLRPLSGRERGFGSGRMSIVTHDITIRHRDGVLPEKRLVNGTRVFKILAVLDDARGDKIVCHCAQEVLS
ncbi:MAG: phage head closure protein [Alphaproteobacteria bacterium]